MSVRVEMEGWEELERKLQSLGDRMQSQDVLEEALMAGAEVVREAIAAAAPRRTGILASDIHVSRKGRIKYSVRIGPGLKGFYGRFLEYGTSKMAARPFMRPAFEASNDAAQEAIRQSIWQAVQEAAERA